MKIRYVDHIRTFSGQAAIKLKEEVEDNYDYEASPSIEDVAKDTQTGDLSLIPAYNRTIGIMFDHLALVEKYGLVMTGRRIIVPVSFYAGVYPGCAIHDPVYSIEKALAQCSQFISERGLAEKLVFTSSTVKGIELVKKGKHGIAIASKDALLDAGLEIIAEDIGNKDGNMSNFTEFIVVTKL